MRVGFIGLGKMGSQMVERLLAAGHEVVVSDHHQDHIDAAVAHGAVAAASSKEVVQRLAAGSDGATAQEQGTSAGSPRANSEPKADGHAAEAPSIIWLMIAARAVDDELAGLLPLLSPGSIVIDGGNSDFHDTRRRAETCAASGVQLVDVGTSGGILGLEHGFSMMVGGSEPAFKIVEPLIRALAQPGGYGYFGPSGAGHYVKMIHNAIEYGVMESYAEGYNLLKNGRDYAGLDLAKIAGVWQHGSIVASGLNEIIRVQLAKNPELNGIDGFVHESGEARWALETAAAQTRQNGTPGSKADMQAIKIELPAIQVALDARLASQQGRTNFGTKLLAAMRNGFGGHQLNK